MFMPTPGFTTLTTTSPMISATVLIDLEVEQRQHTGLADRLHAFHSGDAGDDGAEDDRPNHHFHELDEAIAQRPHLRRAFRRVVPEQHADHDGDQDLKVERAIEGLRGGAVGSHRGRRGHYYGVLQSMTGKSPSSFAIG